LRRSNVEKSAAEAAEALTDYRAALTIESGAFSVLAITPNVFDVALKDGTRGWSAMLFGTGFASSTLAAATLQFKLKTRLNLAMADAPEIIAIALKLKPDIVCLVPERPLEVTTEAGLDVAGNVQSITDTRKRMNDGGIEVSLFIAPDPPQIEAAARTGSQFIELHTGAFAEAFDHESQQQVELDRLIAGARQAHALGLKVNAGHGLN
jgi:hypothetical protein